MKLNWLVRLAAIALSSTALANKAPAPQVPYATLVSSIEIQAAVQQHGSGALSDSVLRVVPIGSKYNVGVAVVRRSEVNGHMLPDALVHDSITEIYSIISGKGVLVTGGALQSPKHITNAAILGEIGPSLRGQSIVGGIRHSVGPGDVIIIPAGTPHGFAELATPQIVYTLIRIDPNRVLPADTKAQ